MNIHNNLCLYIYIGTNSTDLTIFISTRAFNSMKVKGKTRS
jgi:hypothetical protein